MQLPEILLQSLEQTEGFDKKAFERVHESDEQVTSIRINPAKWFNKKTANPGDGLFHFPGDPCIERIGWSEFGFYLDQRPSFTFDPLFHAGCYYVQEASSMFLEQALKQTIDLSRPLRLLDLSAAPGGKSTHIQSLISPESLLVSNEVIRSRAGILKDNLIRWGSDNVMVTNNDPRDFATLENYFDIIVVDAPCSGSGLFRRDPGAINEWNENNVALCSQRQQRILADVLPALKKEGILIYSTCSYSREEDEGIADWLLSELPVVYCPLSIDPEWQITESKNGYRFWPDKVKGEGFFIACFKKSAGGDETGRQSGNKAHLVNRKEKELIEPWVSPGDHQFISNENTVYAWPGSLANDMNLVLSRLKVVYSGVRAGELMRDKLIPDHALAMSGLVNESVEKIQLNYEQSIQYLQRKELIIDSAKKGWQLVTYEGHVLGWINVLTNRINNYYPKELRILKELKSPPR